MVKTYWVKMNYRFNLDSMLNTIWCALYDMRDGKIDSVTILGEEMTEDRLEDFREEVETLLFKATTGKVTGKEYGRIKAISDERNMMRYSRCLASGMSDEEAAYAFFD